MRRNGLTKTLARWSCGLLLMVTAASALAVQDLLESYRLAQASDPQLAAAAAALRVERERLVQARALFLPQLGLEAGVTRVWQDVDGLPPNVVLPEEYDSSFYGLGLTQPLYRQESFALYAQARLLLAQAELGYARAQQELVLRVAQGYFRVLQAEDGLRSYEAERAALARQLARAERAFALGGATVTDVHEARARLDLTEARRLQARHEVQLAREALRRLTGAAVVGELARLPAGFAPPVLEPAAAQAWVARAEAESLEVRLARYGVALAREEVARQRAQRFPQLDLVARYGRQDGVQLQQGLEATVSERAVGLQLRLPLYAGGGISAQVRAAQAGQEQAQAQLEAAVRAAGLAAESAYLQLEASRRQVQALEQALRSLALSERSTARGVELGLRSTLDLLDVQRERFAAERDLAAARYGYLLGYLQLQAAVGAATTPAPLEEINQLLVAGQEDAPGSSAP